MVPGSCTCPHEYRSLAGEPGKDGTPGPYKAAKTELALYNLENDVGEKTNVAEQNPEVVKRLLTLVEEGRTDLGDSLTNQTGKNRRPPGKLNAE